MYQIKLLANSQTALRFGSCFLLTLFEIYIYIYIYIYLYIYMFIYIYIYVQTYIVYIDICIYIYIYIYIQIDIDIQYIHRRASIFYECVCICTFLLFIFACFHVCENLGDSHLCRQGETNNHFFQLTGNVSESEMSTTKYSGMSMFSFPLCCLKFNQKIC